MGPQFVDEADTSIGGIAGSSSTVSRLSQKVKDFGDPCRTDLVLREVKAGAIGLLNYASTSVHLAGNFLTVPNGVCSMNVGQWPGVGKPSWLGPPGSTPYPQQPYPSPPYPQQPYPPQPYPPHGPPPSGGAR